MRPARNIDPVAAGISFAIAVLGLFMLTGYLRHTEVFGLKGLLIAGPAGAVGYYGALLLRDRQGKP